MNLNYILLMFSEVFRDSITSHFPSGEFQIYIFNVGQGDSQLIVYPSGYSIFIDINEANWNTDKGSNFSSQDTT